MASYLDKFLVRTAIEDSTKLDLSCQHITTSDFMQLNPVYCKEMVPGEKIIVSQETFTRLQPLTAPTFGRANVHNRAFFVPYRTVWSGWTDFITDAVHVGANSNSQLSSSVPTVTSRNLLNLLMYESASANRPGTGTGSVQGLCGTITYGAPADTEDTETYDIYWSGDSGLSQRYIKLNFIGRQILKVLNSLGYVVAPSFESTTYSLLPLLAFVKVYIDWYFPSAYYGDVSRTILEQFMKRDIAGTWSATPSDLWQLCALVGFVNYDSDYFVSAFDKPDGPTVDSASTYNIPDLVNNGTTNANMSHVVSSPTATTYQPNSPVIVNGTVTGTAVGNINKLSQYMLNALRSLTDYMKRHQLVGARAMDRYLARFGKSLSAEKISRSLYIGAQSFPIQFGDIMSTADTGTASLGDFAGKGVGYGGAQFEHETDEYGMFFICNSIVPAVGYYQGVDRTVLHKNILDFWTPEFDQLGNQPIYRAELYMNSQNGGSDFNTSTAGMYTGIFGFAPRYAEYKLGRDRLTGDFRVPSLNGGTPGNVVGAGSTSNVWHLMREFNDQYFLEPSGITHSKNFVQGNDAVQYSRIFQVTADNTLDQADHFNVIHNFNVVSFSPMHPLYDSYEFDSRGKDIKADVNGVKVN